jgi:hypothetical protein
MSSNLTGGYGSVSDSDVDLGVNGHVRWESHLHFVGRNLHRTHKASRPTSGEQLLRVGAVARRSRRREFNIQTAARAAGHAAFPATEVWVLAV